MTAILAREAAEVAGIDAMAALVADPLLGRGDRAALARLLPHVTVRSLPAGTTLYTAGESAALAFVILDGEVELSLRSGRTLAAREHCGEEAGIDAPAYLTTATVVEQARLLCLPRAALRELVQGSPALRTDLLWSLSGHLAGEALPRPSVAAPPAAQPRTRWVKVAGWSLTLVLPLLLLVSGSAGAARIGLHLDTGAVIFLGVFLATVLMWVFSLVDDYIPALFALLAILVTGLVPAAVIVSGFGSSGFLMAMSTLALGTVVVSSGLSYRCMVLLLSRLPNGALWHNAGVFLTGAVLTPMIPTANGRVALMAPFLADMVESLRLSLRASAATRLAASAFAGLSLLSASMLTSKSVNFAVYGLLPAQDQAHFQWITWFAGAAVAAGVLLGAHAVLAAVWFRSAERPHLPRSLIAAQLELLGPLKNREWVAVGALAFVFVGIVTSQWHGVPAVWLVLAMLLVLLLFGTLRRKELNQRVDWSLLLYLSGVTGLVGAFKYLGIDGVIVTLLPGLKQMMENGLELFVLLLFVGISVVRIAVPINATIVIAATILLPVAELGGVNPWVVGFMILLFAECWFLPYQCSYYLQFRQMQDGSRPYDEARFLRFNAVMNLVRPAAVYLSLPYWHALGYL